MASGEQQQSVYVRLGDRLAQFQRRSEAARGDEPTQAYWEENWKGVTDEILRHSLRSGSGLATHTGFFRRQLSPGARILEAGCGTGVWVRRLNQAGYHAVGLDYAHDSLRRSKLVCPELPLIVGDLRRIPAEDDSYDAYMSFGVIEHFRDGPREILSEALRVLRPGGVALVSTPYANPLRRRIQGMDEAEAVGQGYTFHQFYYGIDELREELARAGFEPQRANQPYSVRVGIESVLEERAGRKVRLPLSKALRLLDFAPLLPRLTAHMVFAVGVKPG